jgi:hypothetical protein
MTKLKSVNIGHNKFCGPAVLSILTGRNTDECAKVIRSINGHYEVAGVQLGDLLKAADKLGFDNQQIPPQGSLYRTLVGLASREGFYIITVPLHFVVIEVNNKEIFFCDNHTKEPIRAASSARLMQQCVACYRVERRKDYVEPEPLKLISEEVLVDIDCYYDKYHIVVRKLKSYNYSENNTNTIVGTIPSLSIEELHEVSKFLAKLVKDI